MLSTMSPMYNTSDGTYPASTSSASPHSPAGDAGRGNMFNDLPRIRTNDLSNLISSPSTSMLSPAMASTPGGVVAVEELESPAVSPTAAKGSSGKKGDKGSNSDGTKPPTKKRKRPAPYTPPLAPDQPRTTQGCLRTRVYVACVQCRQRKIRCDGVKPACYNCARKPVSDGNECCYDSVPKRRGPDRKPGARHRSARRKSSDAESPPDEQQGPSPQLVEVPQHHRSSLSPESALYGEHLPMTHDMSPGSMVRYNSTSPLSSLAGSMDLPLVSPLPVTSPILPSHSYGYDMQTLHPQEALVEPWETDAMMPYLHAHHQTNGIDPTKLMLFDNGSGFEFHEHPPDPLCTCLPCQLATNNIQLPAEPSLDFTRKTWWDTLIGFYSPSSITSRDETIRQIHFDLRFLFKTSNHWLSFINVPLFFGTFCDPVARETMQPSLVLACLAMATFLRSSEIGLGRPGRDRAMWLRQSAQNALQASLDGQWLDGTLAQAAWILAQFEISAHEEHDYERTSSALSMLDNVVRALSYHEIDRDASIVSRFRARRVPSVARASLQFAPTSPKSHKRKCVCNELSLGKNWSQTEEFTPLWPSTPAWQPDWSVADVKKEEARRLVWSSLTVFSAHTSSAVASGKPTRDFFLISPENYQVFFPGEKLTINDLNREQSMKETVWALYARAMLLWNTCLRVHWNVEQLSEEEKGKFVMDAWIESTAIEKALNEHSCATERAFLFYGRELLFNTRMCISQEFTRYIPSAESEVSSHFNRKKAEEWLAHQSAVATRLMQGLHTVTGQKDNVLARRPFFIWWFMSQISRALSLWDRDQTLSAALDVALAFLPPSDYLTALWPCPSQRRDYVALRDRLSNACLVAGRDKLPPMNLVLPTPSNIDVVV